MAANARLAAQVLVARTAKKWADEDGGEPLRLSALEEAEKLEKMKTAVAKSYGKGGLRVEDTGLEEPVHPRPAPEPDMVAALRGTFVSAALKAHVSNNEADICLLYTSPSPRDLSTSRMPSSA